MPVVLTLPAKTRQHDKQGILESWRSFPAETLKSAGITNEFPLFVINDDRGEVGLSFPWHGHRDMEILSFPILGALAHSDTLGNGAQIQHGEIQLMTAGSGIRHSEWNPSKSEPLRFLQVWVYPHTLGLPPSYVNMRFDPSASLTLLAAQDGGEHVGTIKQYMQIWRAAPRREEPVDVPLPHGRLAWIHVVKGELVIDEVVLGAGDGAAIAGTGSLRLASQSPDSEVLVFASEAPINH
jgi:redox-sensitive bicupin YhaK (pirin superfamily)